MPYPVLNEKVVIEVYRRVLAERGIGSARETAERLAEMGYRNHNTGAPLTKQAVLECLRKSEEGKALLAETSKTKWRTRYAIH